jgi:dihydroorotase
MEAVTPTIQQGGVETVYVRVCCCCVLCVCVVVCCVLCVVCCVLCVVCCVLCVVVVVCVCVIPNLVPSSTPVEQALSYQKRLQNLSPDVTFLMSLYLHPSLTPSTIKDAKAAGIRSIQSYSAGVTTNSASGVVDYAQFYPIFAAMEEQDLILNLHGESPLGADITVLNAEEKFLPTLLDLHRRFPKLRIILEHCTTAAAIEAVKECGPNVAGTITAHHLFLIVDDWANDPFNYCKPVAKLPQTAWRS